ncbi:MAG: HD-GYP domain-containing protein [Dehalococcoidia bacterium]|nr:HD-GYP domain-containing protein [Dehalococcoidia bacterium]MDD5494043.1 HD-GYP domain-containing protein [Dehalococcoidia bacterium]
MSESLLIRLFFALDTVVAEQRKGSTFEIIGAPPVWFTYLFPQLEKDNPKFIIEDDLSFLGGFVKDAARFWKMKEPGQILWSGPWEETLEEGNSHELEAGAIYLEDKNILFVRLLGHSALADREMIQQAREHLLSFENLFRADRDLKNYSDYLEQKVQQRTLEVTKTLAGVISAIITITEMRDPYTAGHQRRVAQLACAIAGEMERPAQEIEGLRMAGVLHDIGKICVPGEILSKPGRLNEMEMAIIRQHPQAGYDILKNIDFPRPIAQIILQHHENIDGSGYPRGLAGEDILLKARILRVADVVEAMASYRPYRPEIGLDQALEEIKLNRGKYYDVNVADACLKLFAEGRFQFD